jgi:integrase/recombinase XerD
MELEVLEMSLSDPCLIRSQGPTRGTVVRVGMPLVHYYLEFFEGRCRPNTCWPPPMTCRLFHRALEAIRWDEPADVLSFITAQRTGRTSDQLPVVDPGTELAGVATSTGARRLSIISGFLALSPATGDITANPVPPGPHTP